VEGLWFGGAVAFGRMLGPLLPAAGLMGLGVWLHLTERHGHPHYPDIHHRHGH